MEIGVVCRSPQIIKFSIPELRPNVPHCVDVLDA